MQLRHLMVERRHVMLLVLLLQLVWVHCLRPVHPLRLLLRRLVHVYW